VAGVTDEALLRLPPNVAAQILALTDPNVTTSTRIALASKSTTLAANLVSHFDSSPSVLARYNVELLPVQESSQDLHLVILSLLKTDAWAMLNFLSELVSTFFQSTFCANLAEKIRTKFQLRSSKPLTVEFAKTQLRHLRKIQGPVGVTARVLLHGEAEEVHFREPRCVCG